MKKRKLFILSFILFIFSGYCYSQQNMTVTGTITSALEEEPLIGVSVAVKGTQVGTMTDINGNYSISAPKGSTLVFTYIGMITKEIKADHAVIDVILQEDNNVLEEMVVIGYGVQKRSDITGTISSIKMDDITKLPVTSVAQALEGAASGLQVVQNSGQPGAGATVRIRGVSSINGGLPMWVIDGVPGNPDILNPNDIESIEVLKDASTGAIYGVNGANGVILITTKQGKKGALTTSLNAYYGIQNVVKRMDMANGQTYAHYINEKELIAGTRASRLTFPDPSEIYSLPSYDYQKDAFVQASTENYEFSASMGTDKGNVYMGLGYFNQDGVIKGSNYKKLNLLVNSEYKVKSWLTVGERASFVRTIKDGFPEWKFQSEYESPLMTAAIFSPYQPDIIVDETDGKTYWAGDNNGNVSPTARLAIQSDEHAENYSGSATFYAKIEPVKSLVFESRITGNIGFSEGRVFQAPYEIKNTSEKRVYNNLSRNYRKDNSWQWQNFVTYSTNFADKVNVSGLLGMEAGENYWHDMGGQREKLFSDDKNNWYFNSSQDNATLSQIVTGNAAETSYYSYFGRISADYMSKYLVQFILRHDASSLFGPDHRTGTFPSWSLGWKFSEEEFMKNQKWLSFGKLRYAFGSSGNNTVDPYQYYATAAVQAMYDYRFDNSTDPSVGAAPTMLANKAIHWETIKTTNLGIDLGFLNNRLMVNVDYFTRKNTEMLIEVPVPDLAGWYVFDSFHEGGKGSADSNVGEIENKGLEFTASWKHSVNKDFAYGIDANFTYVKNKAVDLNGEPLYRGSIRGISGYLTRTIEGGGIGEFYGYKTAGIFQESDGTYEIDRYGNTVWTITNQPYTINENGEKEYAQPNAAPGDYKFLDVNGDGKITEEDKVSLGNPHPKYLFGITLNASYKWIDFSMFWTGALGQKIFNGVNAFILAEGADGSKNLPQTFIDGHWRPAVWSYDQDPTTDAPLYAARQENATWARYDIANANSNFNRMSDIYIENGSYVKLQNIQVGFTLPEKWVKTISLSNVRLYAGVYNVFTFTKYSGMDPQLNSTDALTANIDRAGYPSSRSWTFGCNINF